VTSETKSVISTSPFRWSEEDREHCFSVVAGNVELGGTLFPPGIVKSLVEQEGECDIVVCGCGVAECAGFFNERFHKTQEHVIWEMKYRGVDYELSFERSEYQRDALKVLHYMAEKNVGWNAFAFTLYRDIEEFRKAVKQADKECGRYGG